eukprot:TRINITY_DN6240_c0_g1_i1.p1 TRINITY_DN6240_c0_g1~~TRINITY_DN6240_c0_g1_i1.p1  ORF type:complete len:197 (+),score=32.13 TRINITY_DN6240_c0_g1_i1:261-851(+)
MHSESFAVSNPSAAFIRCHFNRQKLTILEQPRLLSEVSRVQKSIGMACLLVNHATDTRFGMGVVASKNGTKMSAISCPRLQSIDKEVLRPYRLIAIDEAQFFDEPNDLVGFCSEMADVYNKIVLVSALSGNFKREPMGWISHLIPHCDRVEHLHAVCSVCGRKAPFTLRKVYMDEEKVIGGSELYESVCRKHYKVL